MNTRTTRIQDSGLTDTETTALAELRRINTDWNITTDDGEIELRLGTTWHAHHPHQKLDLAERRRSQ